MAKVTKSGVFTLWLVNLAPGNQYYWGEGTMWSVGNYLQDMFQKVIAHDSCPFEKFYYSWERGTVQPTDIVVYFLASQADSIIKDKYKAVPKHNSGSGGTFPSPDGMISEVYLRQMEGDFAYSRLVAKLAFHECMHNKIDAAPGSTTADIHKGDDGLAAANISNGTDFTDTNISLMAANLNRKVVQFTETMNATTKFLF